LPARIPHGNERFRALPVVPGRLPHQWRHGRKLRCYPKRVLHRERLEPGRCRRLLGDLDGLLRHGLQLTPTAEGDYGNTCPAASVLLSTQTFATYQWLRNGIPIPGATSRTYSVPVTGNYSVYVTDTNGCLPPRLRRSLSSSTSARIRGLRPGRAVPARLVGIPLPPRATSSTSSAWDSAEGYEIFEGDIGNPYSHENARATSATQA